MTREIRQLVWTPCWHSRRPWNLCDDKSLSVAVTELDHAQNREEEEEKGHQGSWKSPSWKGLMTPDALPSQYLSPSKNPGSSHLLPSWPWDCRRGPSHQGYRKAPCSCQASPLPTTTSPVTGLYSSFHIYLFVERAGGGAGRGAHACAKAECGGQRTLCFSSSSSSMWVSSCQAWQRMPSITDPLLQLLKTIFA